MSSIRRSDEFEVDGDLHLVPYHDAARLERLIPVQPEILAIDRRRGAETDAFAAPGVLAASARLDRKRDRSCRVTNRQVAGHRELTAVRSGDARAPEPNLGILIGFEEVGRAQVRVPLLFAR